MHWLFCAVIDWSFDLPILFLAKTIEENLEKEIDFRLESRNQKVCKQNFLKTQNANVYVPNLFDDYTRKRVLVMEWIEGVKITEFERMARQKLNVSEAIKIVIEAFAE